MGVDYFNCPICNSIFNDCGPFGWCSQCERRLCGDCHAKQIERYGQVQENSYAANDYGDDAVLQCDCCSGKIISDSDIIDYLLEDSGTSKEDVIDAIKKQRKEQNL